MIKMSAIQLKCSFCLLLVVVGSLPGCSDPGMERPSVVPVSGVVMYKSEPVSGATVSFMNDSAPRQAVGVTNEKGEFKLTTFDANDGAVIGTHKITVTKVEASANPTPAPSNGLLDPAELTKGYTQQVTPGKENVQQGKALIPAKYGDMKTTPLSEEVKADTENHFNLQLSD